MRACQRTRRAQGIVLLHFLLAALAGCGGCTKSDAPPASQGQVGGLKALGITADELFRLGLDNLDHLDQYHSAEMLEQVIERLNQWARHQEPIAGWKPDPLLDGLPPAYKDLPAMRSLDKLAFPPEDGFALMAGVWIRDLSKSVRGQSLEEIDQARRLFDWTVRNIQLQPAALGPDGRPLQRARQFPWETLLFGHGTPLDRAWVFILLARQQGIDAAVIALAAPDDPDKSRASPWAVGVLSGGQVYLFDPAIGLPVPGPGGVKLGPDGQLDIHPATLRQLAGDPRLLRRLDLDAQRRYPVTSADLARAVAQIAASPSELSMRMQMVEEHLAGEERMALSVHAAQQAKRFAGEGRLADARLWTRPFSVIEQRVELVQHEEFVAQQRAWLMPFQVGAMAPLWRGRIAHLRGSLSGERGAAHFYQMARPPDAQIDVEVADGRLPPALRPVVIRAKQDATYWLGLVSFELGSYQAAIDYLRKRTLESGAEGPWKHGAVYNLGRTYEAAKQYEAAIAQYEADADSPGHHGTALRARWLKELAGPPTRPTQQEGSKPPADGVPSKRLPAKPGEQAPAGPKSE